MSSNIRELVKDRSKLTKKSKPVYEGEDVERYADILFDNLIHYEGIGLSAPQVGINKRICVVNVLEPIVLVNPRIIEREGTTSYIEACLSFPGEYVTTDRNIRVTVKADNFESPLTFGPESNNPDADDEQLLESVAVQHEIDHLHGIIMFDRKIKKTPIKTDYDFGRNDKVVIKDIVSGETKNLKFKYAKTYLDDGWKIIN